MTAQEIRQKFLDFFASKGHKIVPSAPIVNKDDPSLMFTNAGMNQFKDFFLGNQTPDNPRIADTQKCLRVSGKHNDLEEVGIDSYHHTMFEMLGNWSIGDYFKKEAIDWAWELLTKEYGLDPERLYVTVFEGDSKEKLERDEEAAGFWKAWVPEEKILFANKKDNFWEMGETGPCGPCSEIHVDLRSVEERKNIDGATLVNKDHPLVIEIWNLVFIQFNRKADRSLENLPARHIDTGMGFERLCMALQGKQSNYETDVFMPMIQSIEKASGKTYTNRYEPGAKSDIAMRVVVDHIRAVAFAIADGLLPSNTGAGYVIRRILRRAVRYYYSFLDIRETYLHKLIPTLASSFANVFPELEAQKQQVAKVIEAEEKTFLSTLESGLKRFEDLEVKDGIIGGVDAFKLYDTYGFPIDLTRLLASEKGFRVDEKEFEEAMQQQKAGSKKDAAKEVGDWTEIEKEGQSEFVGYDHLVVENTSIIKYRTVASKKKKQYEIVLGRTPFYGESGGQRGDKGELLVDGEQIKVINTIKQNELTVHLVDRLPANPSAKVTAKVEATKRRSTSRNHSAVHLMHAALHRIIGEHAVQKGQDVDERRLRFDFSHFEGLQEEQIREIERMVNEKIRADIALEEDRNIPIDQAREKGAMMLFGEKYGDEVRVITFDRDFSSELCGGTHVPSTGQIGQFKILAESAVAAGIRRIEAVTADVAEEYIDKELAELKEIRSILKSPQHAAKQVEGLQEEIKELRKEIEQLHAAPGCRIKKSIGSIR